MITKLLIKVLALVLVAFVVTPSVSAQTATVSNLSAPSNTISQFQKVELSFTLSKEYPNPYYYYDSSDTPATNPSNATWFGVDGVTVDMVVSTPAGTTVRVPAFYYQDYTRQLVGGYQILGKVGKPVWKVRYTPSVPGAYTYYISVQDKNGTTRYPQSGTQSFTVSAGNADGFVRTSTKDSRYLAFDSGRSFIPIGAGSQWYPDSRKKSIAYEELFGTFKTNGVNFLRIWDEFEFQLGVEGAQTFWTQPYNLNGAAVGVEISSTNVRNGLRAARPTPGQPWYQRVAIASPGSAHTLTAWVKYANLSGGNARIFVRQGIEADTGTILGQSAQFSGTSNGWTKVTFNVTPNTSAVSVVLENSATGGNFYVDDVEFGPVSGSEISYDILTDGDFERHFTKGNPGNDPDANRALVRPFGNYVNQHTAYELDKIISSAELNGVYLQLCSCSGPWFTWPQDPDQYSWSEPWVLKSWQRNFRHRVARWGYSPAVLAWEHFNETGHVPPGTDLYTFYQTYGAFQKLTDIYGHLRTTSQNSQAYSPGLWSSNAMDLANYHDYLDFRGSPYTTLSNDEVSFVQRFSWCLRGTGNPATNPYCQGLGLGDGTTWTGNPKPWVWGEIGIQQNGQNIQGGEAGSRFLHNIVWAGLFSPLGTTPLDWFQDAEDATSRNAKWAARKSISQFFKDVDYDGGVFTHLTTTADVPPGYATSAEKITAGDQGIRALALKRGDKKAVYAWVQNRDHIWSKASTTPSAITSSLSFPGLLNGTYRIQFFDTRTGQVTTTQTASTSNGILSLTVTNLIKDIAIKIEDQAGVPTLPPQGTTATTAPTGPVMGNGDANMDGNVNFSDIIAVLQNWFKTPTASLDQYKDNIINTFDFAVIANRLSPAPTTTVSTPSPAPSVQPTAQPTNVPTTVPPSPTSVVSSPVPTIPPSATGEWTQFARDPQRTAYTPSEVPTPWKWKWSWNGPSSSNGIATGKFGLPVNVQPVTGGAFVYIAAGSNGVYAINKTNGGQAWNARPGGNINSTVAYDSQTGSVFVVSSNGNLYKLNASNGQLAGTYTSGSSSNLPLPPLVIDTRVVYSMGSAVHAVDKQTMQRSWVYDAGSPVDTPPSYSAGKKTVIAGSRNLNFHAINADTGVRVWMKKPTVRTTFSSTGHFTTPMSTSDAEVSYGWPVVSEQNNLVLVKYRLDWNTMWRWSPWPVTNAQMRANLTGAPEQQALFALDLDTGNQRFISNVGAGGFGDGDYLPMGTMPVVKTLPDGNQVAYMIIRGDNRAGFDGRDDSKWGELVLNNSTVAGYAAGDVRFIQYNNFGWNNNLSNMPTDEMPYLSMAGNYLLGGHWMAGKGLYIENRDSSRGSFSTPITSRNVPHITSSTTSEATVSCSNSASHYCTADTLYQEGDRRAFAGPGFYIYYGSYSPAVYDRYWVEYAAWVVSDGLVLYRSTDGAIVALESGNPLASASQGIAEVAGVSDQHSEKSQVASVPAVIPYTSAGQYVGETVTVEGKIVEVFDNGKATYITFSKPHKESFIVRITGAERDSMKDELLKAYKAGDVVQVHGTIGMYQGGPVINPDSLDDIKKVTLRKETSLVDVFKQFLFNGSR